MKPIIILPPDMMSATDIQILRDNDPCVVVAAEPGNVRFVDPIPAASSRTEMENAAIRLSRIVLNQQWGQWSNQSVIGRDTFARMFVDILCNGTPLGPGPTREERDAEIVEDARRDELRRLAREEVRAAKATKTEKGGAK